MNWNYFLWLSALFFVDGLLSRSSPFIIEPKRPTFVMDPGRLGSYRVVAPCTLRPGVPYAVSVNFLQESLLKLGADARENLMTLELWANHYSNRNNVKALTSIRNLRPGFPMTIPIDASATAKLSSGNSYRLIQNDTGRITVDTEDPLNCINRPGMSYNGNDLAIAGVSTNTDSECCDMGDVNTQCLAWTFSSEVTTIIGFVCIQFVIWCIQSVVWFF